MQLDRLYESGYKKRMKIKKVHNWWTILRWPNACNNARHCKTPIKSNIVSNGSYVWLFLLDFPQTEIACWSSIC